MAKILSLPNVAALLLDFDETLYDDTRGYQEDGHRGEIACLAVALGTSVDEAETRFREMQVKLIGLDGTKPSKGQTMLAMGMSQEWLRDMRLQCWHPEAYLESTPGLAKRLQRLSQFFKLAIVSNSPAQLVRRGLKVLGLEKALPADLLILGPEHTEPKPSIKPYLLAAQKLGVEPSKCLSIGDDTEMDGWPAVKIGMGAVIVEGVHDLMEFVDGLLEGSEAERTKWVDFSWLLDDWYKPGRVTIAGVTGLSGAGKTTAAKRLVDLGRAKGVPIFMLDQDWYFFLSRRERREWLVEGMRISPQEHARRSNLLVWWDFEALERDLQCLSRGESLHLRGVYNRPDNGEKTLDVVLTVDPEQGALIVMEGPAIAHFRHYLRSLMFLHTSSENRRSRLFGRDPCRIGRDAEERFRMTQETWMRYFSEHLNKPDIFVDNNGRIPCLMDGPPAISEL